MDDRSLLPWVKALEVDEAIPVCRPLLPAFDRLAPYLSRIDASRRYSNHGQLVLELQHRLSQRMGGRNVALANSGTAAIVGAALAVAGRASPDRPLCLMPAHTFIGTVSAVEQCGYVPHFVDVDEASWQLCPSSLAEHPLLSRAGLVVAVSAYGRSLEQRHWQAFREATGIPVVIDGAAMIEAVMDDPGGCIGEIPVALSFHATKAFCTGEGGAVVSSSDATWRATMQALNFGYDADRLSKRASINGKMSEYHAAVGLAELDGWEVKRRGFHRAAEALGRYLGRTPGLRTAPAIGCNYALFEAKTPEAAERACAALDAGRIGWRQWYGLGAHAHPYTAGYGRDRLETTERLVRTIVGIPMSVDLSESDAQHIARALCGAPD